MRPVRPPTSQSHAEHQAVVKNTTMMQARWGIMSENTARVTNPAANAKADMVPTPEASSAITQTIRYCVSSNSGINHLFTKAARRNPRRFSFSHLRLCEERSDVAIHRAENTK